ncbi:MAG: PilZ domain-containing protein [Deltaproteobacteria bacterium]|nr:PilZ domain-containing protein [Deltaproteobacteria bacterium]
MEERRQFERFSLKLPARMKMITSNENQVFELETWDISAAGTFLLTKEKFSEGTRFKIDLTVPSNRIKKLTGLQSLIESEGSVVRSSPIGVAIRFDRKCQILSLKAL